MEKEKLRLKDNLPLLFLIVKHNWMTMTESVQNYIGSLNWGYRVALRDKKVTYENAYGEFVGPHTIKVLHSHCLLCLPVLLSE